jgi:hypothetical protein
MHELVLRLQHTHHGWRLAGPDPSRTSYLREDRAHVVKLHDNGEPIWSSEEIDLYVAPKDGGIEVTVKIHSRETDIDHSIARAA